MFVRKKGLYKFTTERYKGGVEGRFSDAPQQADGVLAQCPQLNWVCSEMLRVGAF